ncbi:MAG: DNA polymerase/3'-5' exonuclease PolX [Candidatus Aenigmatarchaeota archaeon]
MKNALVAGILYQVADLLEMQDVPFKPQAYRRAARAIESLQKPIEDIVREGGTAALEDIPGVGKAIAEKVDEIVRTGALAYLDELKKGMPINVDELFAVEGVGPKKAKLFYQKLGVRDLDSLERAAKSGKLRKLSGMGEKSEQHILESIKFARTAGKRALLGYILPVADDIKKRLEDLCAVENVEVAGSIRRMKETIGDIDVLVITEHPAKVSDFFTNMPNVDRVVAKGPARSTVQLAEGIECDLRVVEKKSFGSALMYFTGNKDHNIALRRIAIKKGWKLSEYGLFAGARQIAGKTEQGIYRKLGMPYIEPEMREATGEIEAAIKQKLPKLIGYDDVRGDMQTHTKWSDGTNTIEEMAEAAKALGQEYIGISDHVGTLRIAGGMTAGGLAKQSKAVEKARRAVKGTGILHGAEVSILAGGKLDMTDSVLKELDYVVASVHGGFRQSEEQMTARIVASMENEHVDIIGHPTGRLIQERKPYDVDMERLFETSKRTGTLLEINSYPNRLDLNAENVRRAIEMGCKTIINTDAHNAEHLKFLRFGIATARRGWVEKKDVVNALPMKRMLKALK